MTDVGTKQVKARGAVLAFAALCLTALPAAAAAQTVYEVDPERSLAWWQLNPNFAHLWASTCWRDPSWQPGEGRSAGYYVNYMVREKDDFTRNLTDRIPVYPRRTVRPLCSNALGGEVRVDDASSWTGVSGSVTILADSLITGHDTRDIFARRKVFETARYPEIRFTVNGLRDVQPGDTLTAVAQGVLDIRGTTHEMAVPVKVWQEDSGLRVQGQVDLPAKVLTEDYGMSKIALGMGVTLGLWKTLHMGLDLILVPQSGNGDERDG